MPEGKIVKFVSDRGFGFIQPDGARSQIFFHVNDVEGDNSRVGAGMRVSFEPGRGPKGARATQVRLLTVAGEATPPPASEYRFLNPYNFVRPIQPVDDRKSPLLGRAEPPPHDRYVGLTGTIGCRLAVVTPLFCSDSEGVERVPTENKKEHFLFRFFQRDGKPAIPAASLRGAIRSVFEAATSSCFAVLDAEKRLSYHLRPEEALKLVPARVVRDGKDWRLELLPGFTPLAPGRRPMGPQYAAWIHSYQPMRASRGASLAPTSAYARRKRLSLADWNYGDRCDAVVEKVLHSSGRFEFWNVVDIAKPGGSLNTGPGQRTISGYLCINNQNIESKHDERIFFASGTPKTIDLPEPVRERYEELIQDYQDRHSDEVQKRERMKIPAGQPHGRKDAGLSWFIYERTGRATTKLRSGDLVYAMLKPAGATPDVDYIVPVSVPRVGFRQTIGDRLDPARKPENSAHHKCQQFESLCPACRVFGWVDSESKSTDKSKRVAYAGRVRFLDAELTRETVEEDETVTLAILGTPKPTTTRFYLRPTDWTKKPLDGQEDDRVNYESGADHRLRGRKVYRHAGEESARREMVRAGGTKDDQNRSVTGIQQPGSVFEFKLRFENLAPVELGALLWALELEGWHHRIGLGKPLGMGSCRVEVTSLSRIDVARWSQVEASGESDAIADKENWIRLFQQEMEARLGKKFSDLPNIQDLRQLLKGVPNLPVHYPRTTVEAMPEGRNFEWFMGNNRSGRDAGPRLNLPLPEDESEGLPLLDKYGKTS